MNNKKLVAVVIPIYKPELTELEKISFKQAMGVFQKYDICFVMPENLKVLINVEEAEIKEEKFPSDYFTSVSAYNKLMLDKQFYQRFQNYKYILIYQLDAFVFEDKLEYFCSLGYDYIGAPWLSGYFCYKDIEHMVWNVGNGGFSLRKVDSALRLLEKQEDVLGNGKTNEDIFFSSSAGADFLVAPQSVALQFSVETEVRECIKRNDGKLPFGCHAWHRYDLTFWKPYIEEFGYRVNNNVIQDGCEDKKNIQWYEKQKKSAWFWKNEYNIDMLKKCLAAKFTNGDKQYAIWGAGYWGRCICAMLKDAGMRMELFIDGNPNLHDKEILGCKVVGFGEFRQSGKECNVIVALWDRCDAILTLLHEASYVHRQNYIMLQDIELIHDNIAVSS